jgi:folylpolyglutamate synthase/dihydropteroate synthase
MEQLPGRRIHLVFGTLRDKAVEEAAELLFPHAASVTVTQPATPRAASVELLAYLARTYNSTVGVEANPADALAAALGRADANDVVFVTGSLFLVGDCQRALTPQPAKGGEKAAEARAQVIPAESHL